MIVLWDVIELIMDKGRKTSTPAGFEVRARVPLDIHRELTNAHATAMIPQLFA